MSVKLREAEIKESEWWCRHHKDSVSYLCVVMRRLIQAHEEENVAKILQSMEMMKSQLPAFEYEVRC
tara:strand:+ start:1040 stop:1240 length:201 start_codon:yes stop_codon:yes gene_type:complete